MNTESQERRLFQATEIEQKKIEELKEEIEELEKDNEILNKFHAFLARKRQ